MTVCIGPAPLSEDDLFDVVDGEAPPAIRAHLADCRYCRARLQQAQAFHERLTDRLALRSRTLPAFRIALAPWFREPRAVPVPTLREQAETWIRRLLPQTAQLVSGLKGEEDGTQRITARAGQFALVLEAYPTEQAGQLRLKGMVLDDADADGDDDAPFRWAGALVEIGQGNRPLHLTMLDHQAEFEVAAISPGTWDVQISAGWGEILQINGIRLGQGGEVNGSEQK